MVSLTVSHADGSLAKAPAAVGQHTVPNGPPPPCVEESPDPASWYSIAALSQQCPLVQCAYGASLSLGICEYVKC